MNPSPTGRLLPLALTMGEPAGIGPDIALAVWAARQSLQLPPFYCLGDPDLLRQRARRLNLDVPVTTVAPADAAGCFAEALPAVAVAEAIVDRPGQPEPDGTKAALRAIEQGVADIRDGAAAAIVTNPINKAAMQGIGFGHPGHTEYLGELAGSWDWTGRPVMMMVGPDLRTIPVTVHIPFADVTAALTTALIIETGRIAAADLARRFRVAQPRLAVSGLNPHAGESGTMGSEDDEIIAPAVEALRAEGIAATGPLPADTMFHDAARAGYDVALCMYHDQALIPIKALAFFDAVNVTLGLPFVRTSPDHGTAFDIAGRGTADPRSLAAALRLAAQLAANEVPLERAG